MGIIYFYIKTKSLIKPLKLISGDDLGNAFVFNRLFFICAV